MAKPTQITKRVFYNDSVFTSKADTWGGTFGGTWGATWGGFAFVIEGHPTPITTKRVSGDITPSTTKRIGSVDPGTVTN